MVEIKGVQEIHNNISYLWGFLSFFQKNDGDSLTVAKRLPHADFPCAKNFFSRDLSKGTAL